MTTERCQRKAYRTFLLFCLALAALLIGLIRPGSTHAAFTDPGFDPAPNNFVLALLVQPDGKILVGGGFGNLSGSSAQQRIGRLNPDGSLDSAFTPAPVGVVHTIALQNDGKIVVGGTPYLPTSWSVVRLNADGSLDASFAPPVIRHNGLLSAVDAVAVQSDGKVLIGGLFTEVAGQPRQNIARLNADGSLDASFNPGANRRVRALAVQADDKILVGGPFTELAGQPQNYLGRLNTDGSLEVGYPVTPGIITADVYTMVVQPDGKTLVGGNFGGHLRRFHADGSTDFSFVGVADGVVYDIALQADGRIVVGGEFNRINNQRRMYIARLTANGARDGTFNPGTNHAVFAVAAQADGQVLAGGMFTQMGGVARRFLGRAHPAAPSFLPDPDFNPTVNNAINSLALQADGKIVLGGVFTEINGQPRSRVARLNADGSLDPDFMPGEGNFTVNTVAVQADGKILVGGSFTMLGGAARSSLGRLNADGSLDDSFNPGMMNGAAPGQVHAMAVQTDGKILVGGQFNSLGGQPRFNIGRLNSDGSVDADFNPGADSTVNALQVQPDGKILVGGAFLTLSGESRPYFGRLHPDGALDSVFTPTLNNRVQAITLQPDGKILIGGTFGCPGYSSNIVLRLEVDGAPDETFFHCAGNRNHWFDGAIRALVLQPDGRILVGGLFLRMNDQPYETLGRLNGDGVPDSTFNPTTNGSVHALALLVDESILVAGTFGEIGGRPQPFAARLVDLLAGFSEKVYLPMTLR
ncbi:MAG: delta-60 repeat domain-containing protein [Caldilineaceae bacterium]|nr:delta-60 repeat domain-containing protein [Caldilineaceae bacterium]